MALLDLFPHAELFTSIYDPEPWPAKITTRRVHTSFLQRVPRARSIYPKLLPLMNLAFESFDLTGYDLVISSNHSCAKNVITAPGTLHLCYCHTPMRYAWEPRFLAGEPIGAMARLVQTPALAHLRRQDLAASTRPDEYVANSNHVAARIAKYYRRDARVIHPPVDVEPFLETARDEQDYYLYLGRVIPYKRPDLALEACERLGRRLIVAGAGRTAGELREKAGPETTVLGEVDDAELRRLVSGARALLFPGEEDFGIVPVEVQAAGVPVIAYGVGGVRDSVQDGVTGVLFGDQSVDGVCAAILDFESRTFDEPAIRDNARGFATERFLTEFAAFAGEIADRRS